VKRILKIFITFPVILIFSLSSGIRPDGKGMYRKVSPELRLIMQSAVVGYQELNARGLIRTYKGEEYIDVLIQTRDRAELEGMGVKIRSSVGDVVTAALPLNQIESISNLSSVSYIEIPAVCKSSLDRSIPEINADHLHDGSLGTVYKGKGVIIGIIDYGIDWSHEDFIDENGESRILYIWDQTDESGTPPDGGLDYGSEYTREQINEELGDNPPGIVKGKDFNGHGTHVAGIAAGNGRASGNGKPAGVYVGTAPEADLIIVKGANQGGIPNINIMDGLYYIFQKADSLKMPAAVNISLGTQKGPHDATSSFEKYVDNILSEPGRVVVVAAGNDGDKDIHFRGCLAPSAGVDSVVVEFQITENNLNSYDYTKFDIWYPQSAGVAVTIEPPGEGQYGPVHYGTMSDWDTSCGRIVIDNGAGGPYPGNDDIEMWIQISDRIKNGSISDIMETGVWKLIFTGSPGRFDGWLYDSSVGARLITGMDTSTLIAEPGNAMHVITVGSYVSRNSWSSLWSDPFNIGGITVGEISKFTSPGPSRPYSNHDPLQKPEVVAPGEYILSSLSHDMTNPPSDHYIATDSVHWAYKGTSMAAPHVTGVAALIFQMDSLANVRWSIMATARRDEFTGQEVWNRFRGYGKLDALEAVKYTSVEDMGRRSIRSFSLFQNYPNPFNGSTIIEYELSCSMDSFKDVSLTIFDISGRIVKVLVKKNQGTGVYRVRWNGDDYRGRRVGSGLYICRLKIGESVFTRKIIFIR